MVNGVCLNITSTIACSQKNCNCMGFYYNNFCYNITLSDCIGSKDGVFCDLCNDNRVSVNGRCYTPVKLDDINCNVLSLDRIRCEGCNF